MCGIQCVGNLDFQLHSLARALPAIKCFLSYSVRAARKRFELHGGSGTFGERLDRGSFILMDIEHAGQFGDFQ